MTSGMMTLWAELVNYFQGTSPIFSPGYRPNTKLSKKFSPKLMLKSIENHIREPGEVGWDEKCSRKVSC